jgi:hypothetical protein
MSNDDISNDDANNDGVSNDDMAAELEHKNEQLRRAAELGQSLLRRAEELQASNASLELERDLALAAIEDHEYRIAELVRGSVRRCLLY